MFTEGSTNKFPLLQEIVDNKHYRNNGDKQVSYDKRSSRFLVKADKCYREISFP